ncbi:MAG: YqgE/AlgH family protein [Cytophagales bacterium]|nr:YqgE/AlgH family protein [Cytophagales bacterium]
MLDLNNHYLIAMPSMADDDFDRAVVFVFDHGINGAAGLVINRPSESTVKHMFERMDLPLRRDDLWQHPVFDGGPVLPDRGFVLHEALQTVEIGPGGEQTETQVPFYAATLTVPGGLEMTTSHDVLNALSGGAGPRKIFIALGYAAWQAGQLEAEIMQNDWLTVPASNHDLIFDVPVAKRYQKALSLLGVDEVMLSLSGGSA